MHADPVSSAQQLASTAWERRQLGQGLRIEHDSSLYNLRSGQARTRSWSTPNPRPKHPGSTFPPPPSRRSASDSAALDRGELNITKFGTQTSTTIKQPRLQCHPQDAALTLPFPRRERRQAPVAITSVNGMPNSPKDHQQKNPLLSVTISQTPGPAPQQTHVVVVGWLEET